MKNTLFNFFMLLSLFSFGQDREQILDLAGEWKFNIGDNPNYKNSNYNDNSWDYIQAPSSWENQGFQGYNGVAWYRKDFFFNKSDKKHLVLELGYIDDVDSVFFNGVLIGTTGQFPPNFQTAYSAYRTYTIPASLIKSNSNNNIAIKVFDVTLDGGILKGTIGLSQLINTIPLDKDLSGKWDFYTEPENGSQSKKTQLFVPGIWENQGFKSYNGYATYEKTISLNKRTSSQINILVLGKIDDHNLVYVNNQLIGSTGDYYQGYTNGDYALYRTYWVKEEYWKEGKNKIVVKVLDVGGEGGIYEGPVGLISQENYIKHWHKKALKKHKNHGH